jgi:hypothetical protein|tara:strand:- start:1135 stop:1503 length:369 start_codon:yes stop_codon:yes gene_type:complete
MKNNLDKKVIKVGYSDITINLATPNFKKDNMSDCYGQYLQRENKIEIQPELEKIDEANVLLHEILHAIAYISGETIEGGRLNESSNEEAVVNNFSNHLIQVFRDNNWLLSYFINNLLDKTKK